MERCRQINVFRWNWDHEAVRPFFLVDIGGGWFRCVHHDGAEYEVGPNTAQLAIRVVASGDAWEDVQ